MSKLKKKYLTAVKIKKIEVMLKKNVFPQKNN